MIKQYYWKTKELSLQNTGSGNAAQQAKIEKLISKHTISTSPSNHYPGKTEILLNVSLESGDEPNSNILGI